MLRALKNIIGGSLILIIGLIFFVAFLEGKFNTRYYDKEECVEATVTHACQVKESGRYSCNAVISYTTPSGKECQYYLTKIGGKRVDKTKKYLVGVNEFNNAVLVKRDILTGKYIRDKDYTNVLLIFTLAILLVGMFVYIFIPHIHGIIVSGVMIAFGVFLFGYSFIHDLALGTAIRILSILIVVISSWCIFSRHRAMLKENTECNFGTTESEDLYQVTASYRQEKKPKPEGKLKKLSRKIRIKYRGLGETKYTYWGIAYLVAAFILVALGAYLTWGRGEYSGYKCADGVVMELYPFEYFDEEGLTDTDFAAKIEYVTDEGEKRIFNTDYIFGFRHDIVNLGEILKIGYKDDKVAILQKNYFTGKYQPYNALYPWLFMAASVLVFLGAYVISEKNSKEVKRFKRGLGWIAFGLLFDLCYTVIVCESGKITGGIPAVIGVYKCCRAIIWVIRGRDEKKI